ncbi:MAG: DUF3332 domain-containing protein [Muribaculaceae bacterium]|nr:DUF3332 domain-containing protein [Muribaculaceae bacterium]
MRKASIRVAVILTIAASLGLSSCIGSFALTNRLMNWNKTIGNKFFNELVFIAFWVLPVYEVSAMADILVINSIEFWSGSNPMACSTKRIEGTDGQRYLVKCDGKGYDIVTENGPTIRLDFNVEAQRWDLTANGETYELMTFIDPDHVSLPAADGTRMTVSLDQAGLMAYRAAAAPAPFAMN